MTLVSPYYAHLLVYRPCASSGQLGWFTVREMGEGTGPGDAHLVVPVDATGAFFRSYWVHVVTLDEGVPKLLRPFEMKWDGTRLLLETAPADVEFHRGNLGPAPYCGACVHPDFQKQLVSIQPVADDVFDLLFDKAKVVIIGTDPDVYSQTR